MISILVPVRGPGEPGTCTVESPSREDQAGTAQQRRPPREGKCRRCGQDKPINRIMLCYVCWVKTRNEENGWREGQPHPPDCGCDLDCRFNSPSADN